MNKFSFTELIAGFALEYTYLVSSITLLLLFLFLFALNPQQRQLMLVSGLLSTPFAFASVLFVPEYWDPVRIATFGAGPEDILFSFSTGGIVWLCSVGLIQKKLAFRLDKDISIKRYLAVCVSGFIFYWLTTFLNNYGVMTNTLISIFLHGLILFLLQWQQWRIPLTGGVLFTGGYTLFTVIIFSFHPDCLEQWNLKNLSGYTVWGVPVEEILWAAAFGIVWPLFMSYVFQVRYLEAKTSSPQV